MSDSRSGDDHGAGRGCMVRFARIAAIMVLTLPIALLTGCSSSSVKTTSFPVPSNINLAPSGNTSMDLGQNLTFTGTPRDNKGNIIVEPISYQSSNTAVLTIAANGNACAGTWDSLTAPQICTAGPAGVAQVTATTHGVSSPPTTVYVHEHIDKIIVQPVPGQITPLFTCFSKGQTFNYQAAAYNRGTDITDSVGVFSWQIQSTTVAGLNVASVSNPIPTPPTGNLLPGQVQVTAKTPGITSFFASINNVISVPLDFITCPVQSIQLQVGGTDQDTISVNKGTSVSLNPIVFDTQGTIITGVPLNWCSSQPGNVAVGTGNCATNTGATVSVTTPLAGGGTVMASCTPPNCNIGLAPVPTAKYPADTLPNSLPIYPSNVIRFVVTPTTSTPQSATVYVSSDGCANAIGCVSTIIPITGPANTLGTAISLPATPNSLVFDPQGANIYLGTDFSFFNSQGLMKVAFGSKTEVEEFKSVTGKVLTISPDGKKVIVSDTKSTPNQIFVFDTGSSTYLPLPIVGATAASFSPDALKAYIAANDPVLNTHALYVYSTVDPLISMPLDAQANDVSFLADGAFAYVAGGETDAVTSWTTCTNLPALDVNGNPQTVSTPGTPFFIKSLADSTGILAVDPPGVDLIHVSTAPVGCAAPGPPPALPGGLPNVINGPVTSFSLGQGTFVPSQLIASPDGNRIYLLTDRFGSVLVFNVDSKTSSSIALTGSPLPLQASLTPDGTFLYVAANDGTVHVLDTQGGDLLQIPFPTNPETLLGGLCTGVTFPLQSTLTITGASQSPSNTTSYTYTVTSGPPLEVGATVVIQGMADAGNNGVFVIAGLGPGTFTVSNLKGVTASNQSGTGNVNINCNPDLIAVKP